MDDFPQDNHLPSRFQPYLDQEGYEYLLGLCLDHLRGRAEVHQVQAGVIKLGLGDIEEMQCSLDNLVRQVSDLPAESWRERVIAHFGQLWVTLADQEEHLRILQDFEQAKSLLRLRVYPGNFGHQELREQLISKVDFPGTFTNLVLDFDNRFQLLTREYAAQWKVPAAELFDIAQENTNQDNVEVSRIEVKNGPDIFAFFSHDLAVSQLLDFEENASFAKGHHGSLVAIPRKSTAFCVPIDNEEILGYLPLLAPIILQFYEQGPGQITTDFYWYFGGRFRLLEAEESERGDLSYILPEELSRRL